MKHLDLFSGIGGFALATEMVWDNVEHTFCEIDPFCQKILQKHWPNSKIYGDIRTLTNTSGERRQQKPESAHGDEGTNEGRPAQNNNIAASTDKGGGYYLLTGGFPCQPFSQAGRRRGTEDDRHLWPEMLRVIREFHPQWVIGENVGGFVTWNGGMVLEQVHLDLEGEGYEVQAFIIPAVSLNAPHRRDRVWIVAHDKSQQTHATKPSRLHTEPRVPNTRSGDAPHSPSSDVGRRRKEAAGHDRKCCAAGGGQRPNWSENWLEVAARLCTLDDGLPRGLARPKGWRNAALKGAGNAIVPQVAAEIMMAIRSIEP